METMSVEIVSDDGRVIPGIFTLWEEAPENADQVRLDLSFEGESMSSVADSYFDALTIIRNKLEIHKLRPKCFGACKNVYPSPMIRSMGGGDRAYLLRLGRQAKTDDLVPIFDSNTEITPVSVEEQEEFYQKWLKSL